MKILSLPKKLILYCTNLIFCSILLFITILLTFKIEKAINIQSFSYRSQKHYLVLKKDYQKIKNVNQIYLNGDGLDEIYKIKSVKYNQDFANYQINFVDENKLKSYNLKNNQIVGVYDKVSIYSYLVEYIKQLRN